MIYDCTITLTGFEEAWRGAVENAAAQLRSRLREQFLTQGAAYGTPWLARRSRSNVVSSAPLLFRTGRLYRSFTEPGPEHIEEIAGEPGDTTLRFGSAVPYAAAHQWGTVHIPARPILTAEILRGI